MSFSNGDIPDYYEELDTPLLIEFSTNQKGVENVSIFDFLNKNERDKLKEKSNKALDKSMIIIQNLAERISDKINEINQTNRPKNVELDFGIKFDAELGIIIAKASMGATLNVKLIWDL
jgi:hypothetical protein